VLVVGEPGLGKSRLIEEFHARLAETPHTWVEWSASQLLQNTPLHPIAERGRLRFGADAPAEQRLADLEGTLRLIGLDPTEHAPLLAPLVDIPLPPSRTANFSREELRRRQLTAMAAWVLAGARSQPAVVAFEDLHWADPTSLDLMRALAEHGAHGRDDDLAFRFGHDAGASAMFSLAAASWPLGEVDRAISLIDGMQTRIAGLTHVGTLAVGRMHAALFELMRGEHARVAPNVFELVRLAREHDLPMQGAFGVFLEGWATAASGAPADGPADMRRGVELLREQNVLYFDGLLKIALAEAEAWAGDFDRTVAILDEALATCERTGCRTYEAELHRARGETLLARNPTNPAPAEEALLTAISVAKQQGTRSFEVRAALGLAKLYQSTGRPVEAHNFLAPALEGFASTSEMPRSPRRRRCSRRWRRPAAASAQSRIRRSELVRKVPFASDVADPFAHLELPLGVQAV
jgi:predicted ATPase